MTKYTIKQTSLFKKEMKLIRKRGKKLEKLETLLEYLANGKELPLTYKDHQLIDNLRYKNCRECHIEPDWLLVYQIIDNELILLLVETGPHSDLF